MNGMLDKVGQGGRKINFLNFTFKAFNDDQEIYDYLSNNLYMYDSDHIGLCFGFSIY